MRLLQTGVCRLALFIVLSTVCASALGVPRIGESDSKSPAGVLHGLQWRSIGPANMGGRVVDLAVAVKTEEPDRIYAATASGGLFASSDQGTTWTPVFDDIDGFLSIGAVAVAPSDPNILFVGTGEANNRQSSPWGDGIYRSLDGARSWEKMGLEETRHIGRVRIHPTNPDIVFVAATGHLWGPNSERGVFRTSDGGKNWEKVLFIDEDTGAIDLALDPVNPRTVYAAMYQRRRSAWGFAGGGPGSGLYRSLDGGDTWRELTNGLPTGEKGRIGIDLYQSNPEVVYAIVESDPRRGRSDHVETGGVFRSRDRGESWERMSGFNPRPMYFSQIRVDPNDPQRVYVAGRAALHMSHDGGRTFTEPGYGDKRVHPDIHAIWIDPRDSNHIIMGNDGGIYISWNRGDTWAYVDNLPIGQFYEIGVDMQDPYTVCGGLQDNGTWCVPSAVRNQNGITNHDVYNVGGGDGFYAQIDPNDHQVLFVESQRGRMGRYSTLTRERQMIQPFPEKKPADEKEEYLWNWNTPIALSAHDSNNIYVGSNHLHLSRNGGRSWTEISPNLTARIDRDELELMGRKVTDQTLSGNDGIGSYGNVTTISESPLNPATIYAGSDDGHLSRTRDGGRSWVNLAETIPGLASQTYVSRVVASAHEKGRVFATFDGHFNDDYSPHVYRSDDYGQTWKSLTDGLPEQTSVNVIREHPRNPSLLFLGHEKGVHVSIDGGESWLSLNNNLPPVPVDDLVVHPRDNDLVAGTHGRSIWILDDLAPLESLALRELEGSARLLPSKPARLLNLEVPGGWYPSSTGQDKFYGTNPPDGALIAYFLPTSADSVHVKVLDSTGELVRELSGTGTAGMNRIVWDLRWAEPYPAGEGPPAGFGGPPRGIPVIPGKYRVMVSAKGEEGDKEFSGDILVVGDPVAPMSEDDWILRQADLVTLYHLQQSMPAAYQAARELGEQFGDFQKALDSAQQDTPEKLAELVTEIEEIRGRVSEVSGDVNGLAREISGYTGLPTSDQTRRVDWAVADLTETIERINEVISEGLPSIEETLKDQGLLSPRVRSVPLPRGRP